MQSKSLIKMLAVVATLLVQGIFAQDLLVEAESFDNPGGWVVAPQFEQQMGSPYFLAQDIGKPIKNASKKNKLPRK